MAENSKAHKGDTGRVKPLFYPMASYFQVPEVSFSEILYAHVYVGVYDFWIFYTDSIIHALLYMFYF